MTELIYHTDSTCKEFSAQVMAIHEEERSVALDRSAFYPGGGGQPHDLGELLYNATTQPVTRVYKTGDDVWVTLGGDAALPMPGATVQGKIDWDRRFRLMRTHTALHILCGVVFRDYGAQVTGGDMEPLKGRMDFEFESLTKDLVKVIEDAVNREVEQTHDVRVKILPRTEAFAIPDLIRTKINLLPPGIAFIRVVELVGLDLQADGGTHVQNTSQVGHVRVVDYKSKGKINKRLYIEMDD